MLERWSFWGLLLMPYIHCCQCAVNLLSIPVEIRMQDVWDGVGFEGWKVEI
jgi:hypothetical protein